MDSTLMGVGRNFGLSYFQCRIGLVIPRDDGDDVGEVHSVHHVSAIIANLDEMVQIDAAVTGTILQHCSRFDKRLLLSLVKTTQFFALEIDCIHVVMKVEIISGHWVLNARGEKLLRKLI
jgi:hypothetical protein